MERIDGEVKYGTTEVWELRNTHIMPHPIHVHGAQFRVLERINGKPMGPTDQGVKDTVIVWGSETVRLLVDFTSHRGVFLMHCHNLEHEDGGMMLNYEIGDVVSDVREHDPLPTRLNLR